MCMSIIGLSFCRIPAVIVIGAVLGSHVVMTVRRVHTAYCARSTVSHAPTTLSNWRAGIAWQYSLGTWNCVSGTWHCVLGTWYCVLGTWYCVLCTWHCV